jgi:isopenicillin-N epimerase
MAFDNLSRRKFLGMGSALGVAPIALDPSRQLKGLDALQAATQAVAGKSTDEVARDEFYWREIQSAFKLDRTLINLNNGFTCPCPRVVLEAAWRYMEMINLLPYTYQAMVARNIQTIRRRMAAEFGCDEDELALTRGASESMQIVQNGLDLVAGDEVITTEQDYPRMLTTWDQRMRREKIKVTRFQFPVRASSSRSSDSRGWRARGASSPSSMEATHWPISRSSCEIWSAMPTERVCTSGCLRPSETVASMSGAT